MASAASAGSAGGTLRLLDLLLDEQQRLTAVERFAKRHAPEHPDPLYRDLIPLDAPGAGQQLAFQVDLDRCTGCKACVTACHSLNGLDEDETWRSVGRLVGRSGEAAGVPVQQSVTGACHHCEDPACLSGCPVRAYDKDPVTGIVRHLDDQCIGCRYCQLTCPYDVPRFNERLGIVRKCDMCADRLAEGEAPACVQGCPNGAIAIEIVERGASGARTLLPMAEGAAADPAHTRPTTRYVTRLADAQLAAPDADRPEPAAGHDPLALMLVLVQAALGVLLCEAVGRASKDGRILEGPSPSEARFARISG
jgi:Fe-S-cluster-containing dehydrogenase component